MSIPAARIRTSSGWRDIAIQGAPGPAGKLSSAKATSPISFAAADTYYRGYAVSYTPVFDDFGNSFNPNNVFTCRQAGRYLVGFHITNVSAAGTIGIALWTRDWSGPITIGADGRKYGTGIWQLGNLNVGDQLQFAGFHSGGGTATLTTEVIQLAGASGAPPGSPIVVTALPINPTDGTEVYFLADATNGVVWHLRYRAAASGSFKWEFVGGSPLYAEAMGSGTSISAGSFVDGDQPGPSITVPLAGVYEIEPDVMYFYNNTANVDVQAGIKVGAAAPVLAGYVKAGSASWNVMSPITRWFTCAANDAVKIQYYVSTGGAQFIQRTLRVRPVRVG